MPRLIDCHVHRLNDSDVEWARRMGYEKVCLIDHRVDVLREAMRKHPDFVVGVGYMPFQDDMKVVLDYIEKWREIGCLGLKACGASARYDDERHYPAYAKAQEYGMPVFFHTGWLDVRIASESLEIRKRSLADWYHVMSLDRITLDFPRLKLIAFHFGGSAVKDCATLMRNHPNVYADSCFGPARHGAKDLFWGEIGGDAGGMQILAKMVYGTDGMASPDACRERIDHFERFLKDLGATPALRDRIFYKTALHILGLDEAEKKCVRARTVDAAAMDVAKADKPAQMRGIASASDFLTSALDRFGEPTKNKTTCWIGCDDAALHFLFFCGDKDTRHLVCTAGEHADRIWQDDCVEIFILVPAHEGAGLQDRSDQYWHFVVNPEGRASVQKGRGMGKAWTHPVPARVTRTGWAVKLSVPFAFLGRRPKPGERWGLGLYRNKKTTPHETITWTETASSFHDPDSFGRLVFE